MHYNTNIGLYIPAWSVLQFALNVFWRVTRDPDVVPASDTVEKVDDYSRLKEDGGIDLFVQDWVALKSLEGVADLLEPHPNAMDKMVILWVIFIWIEQNIMLHNSLADTPQRLVPHQFTLEVTNILLPI